MLEGITASLVAAILVAGVSRGLRRLRSSLPCEDQFLREVQAFPMRLVAQVNGVRYRSEHRSSGINLYPVARPGEVLSAFVDVSALEYQRDLANSRWSVRNHPSVAQHLIDCMSAPGGACILIFGDYGTGKSSLITFLTHDLARTCISSRRPGKVPLAIPMRFLAGTDLASESATVLAERYSIRPCSRDAFVSAVRTGRVVLLLDGLDELVALSGDRQPAPQLNQLEELRSEYSKIIITSRPSVFSSAEEQMEFVRGRSADAFELAERVRSNGVFRILSLQPLSDEQVISVMGRREIARDSVVARAIMGHRKLRDLAQTPVLLDMLVRTLPLVLGDDQQMILQEPSVAALYELYATESVRRNSWRTRVGELDAMLICEKLAVHMFSQRAFELSSSRMLEVATAVFREKHDVQPDRQLMEHFLRELPFLQTSGGV